MLCLARECAHWCPGESDGGRDGSLQAATKPSQPTDRPTNQPTKPTNNHAIPLKIQRHSLVSRIEPKHARIEVNSESFNCELLVFSLIADWHRAYTMSAIQCVDHVSCQLNE